MTYDRYLGKSPNGMLMFGNSQQADDIWAAPPDDFSLRKAAELDPAAFGVPPAPPPEIVKAQPIGTWGEGKGPKNMPEGGIARHMGPNLSEPEFVDGRVRLPKGFERALPAISQDQAAPVADTIARGRVDRSMDLVSKKGPNVSIDTSGTNVSAGAKLELTPVPVPGATPPSLLKQAADAATSGGFDAPPPVSSFGAAPADSRVVVAQGLAKQAVVGGPPPAPASGAPAGPLVAPPAPAGGQNANVDPRTLIPAPGMGGLSPTDQELHDWYGGRIRDELNKRAGPAVKVPEKKQQTAEAISGMRGANAEDIADYRKGLQPVGPGAKRYNPYSEVDRLYKERDRIESDLASVESRRAEEETGIRGEAQKKQEAFAAQQEEALAERERTMRGITDTINRQRDELNNAKVDPDHFWKSKSTGESIGLALTMILGGYANALAGGKPGENAAMSAVMRRIDADIDSQKHNIGIQRDNLNESMKMANFVDQNLKNKQAAKAAAHISALDALEAKLKKSYAEAAAARSEGSTLANEYDDDGKLIGTTIVATGPVSMRALQAQNQVRMERAKWEAQLDSELSGQISKSYHIIPEHMVGGGGPNKKEIERLLKERRGISREAEKAAIERGEFGVKAAEAQNKGAKSIFIDGQALPAHPGATQTSLDKAQDQVSYATQGLDALKGIKERAKQIGGFVPGDPSITAYSMLLAGAVAQASGSGVPSESDKKDLAAVATPGPRQAEALQRLENSLKMAQANGLKRVGATPGGKR